MRFAIVKRWYLLRMRYYDWQLRWSILNLSVVTWTATVKIRQVNASLERARERLNG